MDTTLILIGVGCIIGAIIGGGVKLVQVELSPVASIWRQILLGIFGVVLVISGLIAGGRIGGGVAPVASEQPPVAKVKRTEPAKPISTDDATVVTADDASPDTAGKPEVEPAFPATPQQEVAAEAQPATLPGKVDIFWCAAEDGAAREAAAAKIAARLQATGEIGRVRRRPLSGKTNARDDYGIAADIVRFDPGERPAAEMIARYASRASGRSFAATPALPGSPSIDYLSVFVCGAG